MKKQVLTSMLLALTVAAAGCGGGSDAPASGTTPPPSTGGNNTSPPPGAAKVSGPMDAVQDPVSDQVMDSLIASFAGTPLQGVAVCVDQIVVGDVVDVVDVLAIGIQNGAGAGGNPAAALQATAAGVQGQVENIVIDLQAMLSALDGSAASCLGNVAPNGSNPLAGTPLAPVGATLAPVLQQVYAQLHGTGSTRPSLSLSTIASLVAQLEFAVNSAFAQVPADVANAPVIGAALDTVQTAVSDVSDTVAAAASSDTEDTKDAIADTMDNLLTGVLLGVVPVTMIETQAGQAGVLSGPINDGINQATAEIASGLGTVLPLVLESNIEEHLSPVTAAVESTVLSAIAGPLFDLLGGAGTNPSNPLGPVVGVLEDFFEGATESGNPLDLIIEVISGQSGCPLAGTPLEALCGLS